MKLALLASSDFQRGFVAATVHTMKAAIAAIRIANMAQHAQQTGLIFQ
jgi:hypothetical protein